MPVIAREAQLDGIYVIRTSEPEAALPAEQAVRSYKNLAQVDLPLLAGLLRGMADAPRTGAVAVR